jgi:glyoxylase-like metal-dependent hydrolase (beta-lactamase superfamily II)
MSNATLQMIDLDQPMIGHRKFLSCWVYQSDELTFIVDPGPPTSAERLIAELRALKLSRLDYILITHIHLDHGASAASVVAAYPEARVLCHERGMEHMVDPTKLWESSLSILGHVAETYGPPGPVPQANMATVDEVEKRGIKVIPTPGHASHHLSFLHEETLYVGEAVGLRIPIPGRTYLRPATPPKFILEVALESIELLQALDPMPQRMAFPHFGIVDEPAKYMEIGRHQLGYWVEQVRELLRESPNDLVQRAHEHFLETDPHYANVTLLDEDIQQRERHYFAQSLEGMVGYVQAS